MSATQEPAGMRQRDSWDTEEGARQLAVHEFKTRWGLTAKALAQDAPSIGAVTFAVFGIGALEGALLCRAPRAPHLGFIVRYGLLPRAAFARPPACTSRRAPLIRHLTTTSRPLMP